MGILSVILLPNTLDTHTLRLIPKNPIVRILFSAIAAFVGFGIWAYIANHSGGHDIALSAGLVQGGLSFVFTLVGSVIMEFMVRLSEDNLKRFVMAVVANLVVVYGFVIGGHIANGTPNILLTILPGLIITLIYCISYSWFLTFGHAAGGDYKMVQLLSSGDTVKSLKAVNLITESTEATNFEARRIVDDIEMGRKNSLYVKSFDEADALIENLKLLGIFAKRL